LVGVVGSLCLGLSLAGCESSGQKSVYQGQQGNGRNLVSGTPQTTPPPALQPAPPPASTAQSTQGWPGTPASSAQGTQGWSNTPKTSTSSVTPTYGSSGALAPMPTGPASNAGTMMQQTGGMDNGKGAYPPPVTTGTPGPVSSNSWPMTKPPSDPAVVQTSGTTPQMDATQPGILPLNAPKSSVVTSQRPTDSYGSSALPPATMGTRMTLPPPPPLPAGAGMSSADSLPPVAPADAKVLMTAPPPVSGLPSNDTLPPLPPPSPSGIQVPPLPGPGK
jgi:hypothetical protein